MTPKITGPLPLAFALAMTVEASGAGIPGTNDGTQPFRPGDLAPLMPLIQGATKLPADLAPTDKPIYRPIPGEQTAQWFPNFPNFPNFLNCFTGMWRNC